MDVSLLGGAVTARRIELSLGSIRAASISGLVVAGKAVSTSRRQRVPLQSWGYVVTGSQATVQPTGVGQAIAAVSLHIVHAHGGLPAGTTMLIAVAGLPTSAKARGRAKRAWATHEPLTVTPPLGLRHYVFPVVGTVEFADTYGAFRADVPGNWHHGDDIFAPLGTPVVAVANGTINRVGWEAVGGWRIWVRDSVGDEFYYAHLSGYAPSDLVSNHVKAGQVIGFVGNTGDAFTTSPHLHFEVHPRPLLHLGYDGAVDPTKYLDGWRHLERVAAPRPVHPPLPTDPEIRKEAVYVFGELLAARHLVARAPEPSLRPHIVLPAGGDGVPTIRAVPVHATTVPARGTSTFALALLAGLVALAVFAAGMLVPLPRNTNRLTAMPRRIRAAARRAAAAARH